MVLFSIAGPVGSIHSVWKTPSRSTRRYVWAPKKSRCPCTRLAGRSCRAIGIDVVERGAHCRTRDAVGAGRDDRPAQGRQGVVDCLDDVGRDEQVLRLVITVGEGHPDRVEQFRPDDAAALPDPGDLGQVEVPAVRRRRRAEHRQPLGIGRDLGDVEGVLERRQQFTTLVLVEDGRGVVVVLGAAQEMAWPGRAPPCGWTWIGP